MNCRSDRFTFSNASADDGPEILKVLEESAFPGGVSLLYTRRPNPYLSYKSEGDELILVLCRDEKDGELAGIGVCSVRELWVNGKAEKVGYLEGLRLREKYRSRFRVIPEGYRYFFQQGRERGIKYYITTILEENVAAQKFLEKRRSYMPDYIYLDDYEVLTYRGRKKAKLPRGFQFRKAAESDIPRLVKFLSNYGKRNQFYPVVGEELFRGQIPGLSVHGFCMLLQDEDIIACGAIWNQRSFKQYIVQSYSGVLKVLYFASRLFRGYALPGEGENLPINMLAFCGIKDGSNEFFDLFLKSVLALVPRAEFISIGLPKASPLLKTARGIRHISYRSRIYMVDPDKTGKDFQEIKENPMYIECATL